MMTSAKDVAKYLLTLSSPSTAESITNLKLQKLLYYVQGFHLAIYDTPLFSEKIQAWAHGPVVPEVYVDYRKYGFSDIEKQFIMGKSKLTKNQIDLVKDVWEIFKSYDGKELEQLSHSEEPWIKSRGNLSEFASSNEIIDEKVIKNYFKKEYISQ